MVKILSYKSLNTEGAISGAAGAAHAGAIWRQVFVPGHTCGFEFRTAGSVPALFCHGGGPPHVNWLCILRCHICGWSLHVRLLGT